MTLDELRRGNYVDIIDRSRRVHLPSGAFFKVIEINALGVRGVFAHQIPTIHLWTDIKAEDICPIKLTPELLLKFGFTKVNDFVNDGYTRGVSWYLEAFKTGELHINTPVSQFAPRFLHTFQNLYYALSNGIELPDDGLKK